MPGRGMILPMPRPSSTAPPRRFGRSPVCDRRARLGGAVLCCTLRGGGVGWFYQQRSGRNIMTEDFTYYSLHAPSGGVAVYFLHTSDVVMLQDLLSTWSFEELPAMGD